MSAWGGCLRRPHPPYEMTTAAVGTYPTGMHPCLEADWLAQQSQGKPFARFTVNAHKQWVLHNHHPESILTCTIFVSNLLTP